MDEYGNFQNITISGCVFLYAGRASGSLLKRLPFVSTDGGADPHVAFPQESCVTDLSPAGLVKAYDKSGLWKLRYLQFKLCHEGLQATVYRPPKGFGLAKRMAELTSSTSVNSPTNLPSSGSGVSSPAGSAAGAAADVVEDSWEEMSRAFSQAFKDGRGSFKCDGIVSEAPVTARRLSLSPVLGGTPQRDDMFSVRCVDLWYGLTEKRQFPFIIQMTLERVGVLEFVGRDVKHMETWLDRLKIICTVHRTFHQALRAVRNPSIFPAAPDKKGDFRVLLLEERLTTIDKRRRGGKGGSNNDPNSGTHSVSSMEGQLSVGYNFLGFRIMIAADAGVEGLRYFRICFDEAPVVMTDGILVLVVELSQTEHDSSLAAHSLVDLQFLKSKEPKWLKIERPSLAVLGNAIYFNRWNSFLNVFVKHYEGSVEDRDLKLTTVSSFSVRSTRNNSAFERALQSMEKDADEGRDVPLSTVRSGRNFVRRVQSMMSDNGQRSSATGSLETGSELFGADAQSEGGTTPPPIVFSSESEQEEEEDVSLTTSSAVRGNKGGVTTPPRGGKGSPQKGTTLTANRFLKAPPQRSGTLSPSDVPPGRPTSRRSSHLDPATPFNAVQMVSSSDFSVQSTTPPNESSSAMTPYYNGAVVHSPRFPRSVEASQMWFNQPTTTTAVLDHNNNNNNNSGRPLSTAEQQTLLESERLCFQIPVLLAQRRYAQVMDEMMAFHRRRN